MVDMSQYIAAKSDQLNADDLIGGPITVRITAVRGMNDKDQPIAISYDGDNGKPYKPGKSMRRVLVNFWGKDGEAYVGRWMRLYRDPEVTFGKIKVGGIRVDAMSHLDGGGEMALAVTKGAKRLFTVKALRPPEDQAGGGQQRRKRTPAEQVDAYGVALKGIESISDLAEFQADERRLKWREDIKAGDAALYDRIVSLEQDRFRELSPPGDDEGDPDSDDGDATIDTSGKDADDDDDGFPE